MNTYYLIENKKYLDAYMISQRLGISKDVVRGLLKNYTAEVRRIQNKKLYPVKGLIMYVKNEISKRQSK